jgi:hypothetical protein
MITYGAGTKAQGGQLSRRGRPVKLPVTHDWRTTDQDEIERRRLRARMERPRIRNLTPEHPIFSNFEVKSKSGMTYFVEIRDLAKRQFHSTTVDFQVNGLGTCKHTEAVLLHLEASRRKEFAAALKNGSDRIDVVPDIAAGTLKVERGLDRLPAGLAPFFDGEGRLVGQTPEEAMAALRRSKSPALRVSQEIEPWLESRKRASERTLLRREYEEKVHAGEYPQHETKVPLYPYQREGMLHLAFAERALLADEMGLGKTIQAIAACALLHRIGKARRVLVVSPASLKTEWEEQIQRFTDLPYQIVFGLRHSRLDAYAHAPFFTLVNYEQMLRDVLEVNARLQPDVVILDEAQRIKNWSAKTAQAIKRLRSRYAFVLTGTPIENRIDELYSIVDFINPQIFGPLFRFNREFYDLDERGRPEGYKNLVQLRERVRPCLLRRRKADVETELPSRSDRNHFVPMAPTQIEAYRDHEANVARLSNIAKRRPLTQPEQEKLLRELQMMRMLCDTPYILDPNDRVCPKLGELDNLTDEIFSDPDTKVVVFSEWVRMLELVRDMLKEKGLGYAWHTGSVPQLRRRAEIRAFKSDPSVRAFLSSDSGGVGLNLQDACVVINCDLPWNPAKLEQRIARSWRKHQMRAVTVINLVSENTIEHRMLDTLADKKGLADGVLDGVGDLGKIKLRSGAQAFMRRLEQVMAAPAPAREYEARPAPPRPPVDRAAAMTDRAAALLKDRLVACEERYPEAGPHSVIVVVVDRDAESWRPRVEALHHEFFGRGKIDPLAPVQLEVLDRSTAEAMERLASAGLIHTTVRATRHLYPAPETATAGLTEEQKRHIVQARDRAARKLRMARVLTLEELHEEAREALTAALPPMGAALAIQHGLPPPRDGVEALAEPLASRWGPAAAAVRAWQADPAASLLPLVTDLDALLRTECGSVSV